MENSTALPSPPPASSTVSFGGVSLGVPVGPIRITGSPGFSSAQRSDDPPISRTMVESSPFSRSTDAPVSARPFHAEHRVFGARRERFVILQAIELARLERARGDRRAHDHFDDVRRQPDHIVHHGAQFVVELAQRAPRVRARTARAARACARPPDSPASRCPWPSPRCPRTKDADRRRS